MVLTNLPQQTIDFQPYLESRVRYERRSDVDFSSATSDARSDVYARIRLGARFNAPGGISGEAQYQFADDRYWKPSGDANPHNSDLRFAFLRYKDATGALTVGRQPIIVGDQRLIGTLEWVNTARSFDGIDWKSKTMEFFGARIGTASPYPANARIFGAILSHGSQYVALLQKHDEIAAGNVDVTTLNYNGKWRRGPLSLETEGAVQTGSVASKRLSAYALHARATQAFQPKISTFLEANLATGGGGPNSTRTFDNLYPTNHPFYGTMDLQGWRNMQELAIGADFKPCQNVTGKASYHRLWLFDAADAWYAANGVANARPGGTYVDPTGGSGKDVGQEWDVEASYTYQKTLVFSAGLGYFQPGSFVRNVLKGSAANQTWVFLQTQYRF
ncbi:MAG: alginate export family protein [Armatimonadetes bacterium]|nr:alginate export family protein [Armatimonadota bacterium]